MKISEVALKLGYEIVTMPDPDIEVEGGYAGDLLSWVMGRAGAGNIWVTIMSNINIVAVASLVGISGIIVAEGAEIPQDVIYKATEQGINIFKTNESSFLATIKIGNVLGIQ